ncbi:unnamed protein product [Thlaspi arvense]|uniref:Uncharacterized protein n=1 Tax=Thlaspi arvense TaxID=13288 RepID=A0AAU9SMA0_THLAR|nr:unnamed protein product [Thlaspi arvense]
MCNKQTLDWLTKESGKALNHRCLVKKQSPMMNKKTYRGKLPTGTPSLPLSTVVVVVSLLAGASIVHNIYKPDLSLPPMESGEVAKKEDSANKV